MFLLPSRGEGSHIRGSNGAISHFSSVRPSAGFSDRTAHQVFFGNHLSVKEMCGQAVAVLRTDNAQRRIRGRLIKLPEYFHLAHHFAEGIDFASQAALRPLARKRRLPIRNLTRAPERRGKNANEITKSSTPFLALIPITGARSSCQG